MTRTLAVLLVLGTLGCDRARLNTGGECTLNSECADPLVCQLERCRRQCVDSRDCGAGLICLRVGELGGVCQLPDEIQCTLSSECHDRLVCRFGTCTTECTEDRDCPFGAECAAEGDGFACRERLRELCVYTSECPEPLVCGPDRLCRLECRADRDCTAPRICVESLCQLPRDGGS